MPKQRIYLLILIATVVRCIIAATINLGNDEVYYLTYAQHLQWNYFDHPPMVALLIRITTCNMAFTQDFFVRLGPIILSAVNTYFVYTISRKIRNENAGFIAALLFTASFYSSIIAGVFIMPDAPQLFFWMLGLLFLVNIVTAEQPGKSSNYNLLLFGIVSGLCIMSKVHGVFLWAGFILYILFYKRNLLTNGYLYLGMLLTAIIISPILFWNIDNHFITYTFHSNRVTPGKGFNPTSFLREFSGGLFYNNPVNYVLAILTLVAIFSKKTIAGITVPVRNMLMLCGLPLIGVTLFIALFRDTLPHWSGPGYIALQILTACYIDTTVTSRAFTRTVTWSVRLAVVIVVLGIGVINFFPGTLGKKAEEKLGKGDVTLDMYNWNGFKSGFKKIHDADIAQGRTNTRFIITNKWFPGSHIDNYIAQPLHLDFVGLGKLQDIHTYAWLNEYRKKLQPGDDAYFLTVSNSYSDPHKYYGNTFETISPPVIVTQYRGNKPTRKLFVYLLKGYRGEALVAND